MLTCLVLWLAAVLLGVLMALHRQAVLRARKADNQTRRLMTEATDMASNYARLDAICQAWKSYAIGYEVFCEATYDHDELGIVNAGTEIAKAREKLRTLGQYDA